MREHYNVCPIVRKDVSILDLSELYFPTILDLQELCYIDSIPTIDEICNSYNIEKKDNYKLYFMDLDESNLLDGLQIIEFNKDTIDIFIKNNSLLSDVYKYNYIIFSNFENSIEIFDYLNDFIKMNLKNNIIYGRFFI